MGTKESAVSKASPVEKNLVIPCLFEWWRWHRCRGPLKNHSWRRIGYAHICTKDSKDHTVWCFPLLHFRLHQVVKNRLSPWDIQCDMMTSNPKCPWPFGFKMAPRCLCTLACVGTFFCIPYGVYMLLAPAFDILFSKCSTLAIRRWSQITDIYWVPLSCSYGYESIPINTIFSGMNIHLPFWCSPGVQGFDTLPYLNLFYFQGGCFRSHQAWSPKAWKLLDRCKPGAQQLRGSAGCSEGPGWAFRNRSKGTASRDYVWIWLKIRILVRYF